MQKNGRKWQMLFINKSQIAQNAAPVMTRKKRKILSVVVYVSALGFLTSKTGISTTTPYPLTSKTAA